MMLSHERLIVCTRLLHLLMDFIRLSRPNFLVEKHVGVQHSFVDVSPAIELSTSSSSNICPCTSCIKFLNDDDTMFSRFHRRKILFACSKSFPVRNCIVSVSNISIFSKIASAA